MPNKNITLEKWCKVEFEVSQNDTKLVMAVFVIQVENLLSKILKLENIFNADMTRHKWKTPKSDTTYCCCVLLSVARPAVYPPNWARKPTAASTPWA